jgi:hypothetical protein
VCGLTGVDDATAINAALIASIAVIIVVEIVAGLRGSPTPRQMAVEVFLSVTIGIGVLALKALAH